MPVRFIESRAQLSNETVEKAVRVVLNQLPIMAAARGGAFLGSDGDVAIVPPEPWPVIDPITGESEEPTAPAEIFRAGNKAGVNKVRYR